MKRTLIVGNWKMNLNVHQASLLIHHLDQQIDSHRDIEVVLAPSMLHLQPISTQIDRRKFRLAAQNAYHKDQGAFTGEVSFTQLRDLVHYVIVGHSERRLYFHESLEDVRDKVTAAVRNGITPILCVGETKTEKRAGESKQVVHDQLTTAISNLTAEEVSNIVIMYEPVWAISTFQREYAKPDEVGKMIEYIKKQLAGLFYEKVAEGARMMYGGSVDMHSARAYLEINDCNGVLPGAASLNYHQFAGIVKSAHMLHEEKSGKDN